MSISPGLRGQWKVTAEWRDTEALSSIDVSGGPGTLFGGHGIMTSMTKTGAIARAEMA